MAFVGFTIIYRTASNHYKRLVLLGNILAFLVSSTQEILNMSPSEASNAGYSRYHGSSALSLIQVFKKLVGWVFHRKNKTNNPQR